MAAFLVIVMDLPGESIAQINSKLQADSTKPHEGIQKLRDYLDSVLNGSVDASVQATSRSTDPSVSTNGSGSAQTTLNLK